MTDAAGAQPPGTNPQAPAPVGPVTAALIEHTLQAALRPQEMEVIDDSHLHAGHAGAREGRHFTVRITSPDFDGLSRLARHRLVYHHLEPFMKHGIHALAIVAKAPGE